MERHIVYKDRMSLLLERRCRTDTDIYGVGRGAGGDDYAVPGGAPGAAELPGRRAPGGAGLGLQARPGLPLGQPHLALLCLVV